MAVRSASNLKARSDTSRDRKHQSSLAMNEASCKASIRSRLFYPLSRIGPLDSLGIWDSHVITDHGPLATRNRKRQWRLLAISERSGYRCPAFQRTYIHLEPICFLCPLLVGGWWGSYRNHNQNPVLRIPSSKHLKTPL